MSRESSREGVGGTAVWYGDMSSGEGDATVWYSTAAFHNSASWGKGRESGGLGVTEDAGIRFCRSCVGVDNAGCWRWDV